MCPHGPSPDGLYRRFSVQRCARCHLGISASEMVMRARDLVYHLNCFTCTTCNKMLTTGDHFGMKDSLVYCRLHFEALLQGEYPAHFNHADVAAAAAAAAAAKSAGLGAAGANPLGLPYYNGVGTVQKGRPRKRKSPGPGADLAAYNAGECQAHGACVSRPVPGKCVACIAPLRLNESRYAVHTYMYSTRSTLPLNFPGRSTLGPGWWDLSLACPWLEQDQRML